MRAATPALQNSWNQKGFEARVIGRSMSRSAAILRNEYNAVLHDEMQGLRPKVFGRLRMKAIEAERIELQRLRRNREIGDDAYHAIEEELDGAEGNARRRARPNARRDDPPKDAGRGSIG